MKVFPGQAKDEKVLLNTKENIIAFFIPKLFVYIWIFIFIVVLGWLVNTWLWVFMLLIFILVLLYDIFLWKNTKMIVTNKRILKFVKNWLFSFHFKELKLNQLTEVVATKQWFVNKVLSVGNIKIVWKDKEVVIWFKNIKFPNEVAMYISRLKDFIQENSNISYEKLKPFIPRKERYLKK